MTCISQANHSWIQPHTLVTLTPPPELHKTDDKGLAHAQTLHRQSKACVAGRLDRYLEIKLGFFFERRDDLQEL